ncbi:MAG: hypothetical protein RIC55_02940 [Pirellulaceae bacterium]
MARLRFSRGQFSLLGLLVLTGLAACLSAVLHYWRVMPPHLLLLWPLPLFLVWLLFTALGDARFRSTARRAALPPTLDATPRKTGDTTPIAGKKAGLKRWVRKWRSVFVRNKYV